MMQKSDNTKQAKVTQRRVASSTTLNRKYVRRPSINTNNNAKSNTKSTSRAKTTTRTNGVVHTDMVEPVKMSSRIRRFNTESITTSRPHRISVQDDMQPVAMTQATDFTSFGQEVQGMDVTRFTQTAQPAQAFQPIPAMQTISTSQLTQPSPVVSGTQSLQDTVGARMQARTAKSQTTAQKLPAKELKDQAIRKALASAGVPSAVAKSAAKRKKAKKEFNKMHFGVGRVVLALSCAAVAVMAIVYFVNLNMPDISLKVAAMQTGIDAAYPGYVPRDFSLTSITSEDKKVTMEFKNSATGDAFTLVEETSSWDSEALLNNYVKENYKDNYTVVKEQGLTIYISGSDACWVNGGVMYKIITKSGSLTNKQIKGIATSL